MDAELTPREGTKTQAGSGEIRSQTQPTTPQ